MNNKLCLIQKNDKRNQHTIFFLQLLVEINGYEFMPNKMIFSRMKNAEKKLKSACRLTG